MIQYVLCKEDANKYIGYSDTRKVIHVDKLENAYRFNTPNEARNAQKKASKKMAYFHVYMLMGNGKLEMEKITKIFMHQMEIKNGKCLKWKVLHKVLKEMI